MKEKATFDQIWNAISGIFNRLNLTEHGNRRLSLTNVALWVCIVKVAISPEASIIDLSALLLALFNYAHKRSVSSKASDKASEKLPNSADVLKEIQELSAKVDTQAKQLEEQSKVVEEARSALLATKVQSSFTKRQL